MRWYRTKCCPRCSRVLARWRTGCKFSTTGCKSPDCHEATAWIRSRSGALLVAFNRSGSWSDNAGLKTHDWLRFELGLLKLPDLHGQTVLDIGAWDGFYSFEAERLGAQRVVALDHYVWQIDWRTALAKRDAEGNLIEPEAASTLPGKKGFDLTHATRNSRVEAIVADFMDMDITALGVFDVVLYLGVLYHMRHPLLALERLCRVTRNLAVIETHAIHLPEHSADALCEFYETNELNNDATNWWAFTAAAFVEKCQAAGSDASNC